MNLFTLLEFVAKRRVAQNDLETALRPLVEAALDRTEDTRGWNDVLDLVTRLYREEYREESGHRTPGMPPKLRADILTTLRKVKDRDENSVDRISVWLATVILSQATIQAGIDDPEEIFLEWVTMEDHDVRPAHVAAHGQIQPIGDKFSVGGAEMRYPGDPTAPIDLWINCRCALRPVLASEAIAASGGTMTDTITWTPAVKEAAEPVEAPAEGATEGLAWHGVLAPEGVASGDGRMFAPNSLTSRDLPLPLTWQKASGDGHAGSVTVAKIETIERVDGLMMASGHFIANPEAEEVIGLLTEFGKFGVSVDADDATMEIDEANEMVIFTAARIASASIVAIPAFAEAYVSLGEFADAPSEDPECPSGKYDPEGKCIEPDPSAEPAPALSLVADVGLTAPAAWFANPNLTELTPLTVTDEGRVFGHLAGWETCHIGFKGTCTAPPNSQTDYAYFTTGQVALDDGTRASVGPITIGGGHASPTAGLRAAVAHYDSTSSVVADVTMGEDEHGIWFSGWVRPGVTAETVTALRASALSGDWRKVGDNLELVAALAVNTPGFPIPRTQIAASIEGQLSLVASGVVTESSHSANLEDNVQVLVAAVAMELRAQDRRRQKMATLAAKVKGV